MKNAMFNRAICHCGVLTLMLAICPSLSFGQAGKTYKHLLVQAFEVPDGTDFPADFAEALQKNLVHQLEKTKRFEQVTIAEKGQTAPADADLVLSGKIVEFDMGNRAARYILPGSGMTKIKASIAFTEPTGSQLILQQDVSGKVVIGVLGGDSKGATNGLAKDVAKAVKKGLP